MRGMACALSLRSLIFVQEKTPVWWVPWGEGGTHYLKPISLLCLARINIYNIYVYYIYVYVYIHIYNIYVCYIYNIYNITYNNIKNNV